MILLWVILKDNRQTVPDFVLAGELQLFASVLLVFVLILLGFEFDFCGLTDYHLNNRESL